MDQQRGGRRPASRILRHEPRSAALKLGDGTAVADCFAYDAVLHPDKTGQLTPAFSHLTFDGLGDSNDRIPTARSAGGRRHFEPGPPPPVGPHDMHRVGRQPAIEQHPRSGPVSGRRAAPARALVTQVGAALNHGEGSPRRPPTRGEPSHAAAAAAAADIRPTRQFNRRTTPRDGIAPPAILPARHPPPFALDDIDASRRREAAQRSPPRSPLERPVRGFSREPAAIANARAQLEAGVASRDQRASPLPLNRLRHT